MLVFNNCVVKRRVLKQTMMLKSAVSVWPMHHTTDADAPLRRARMKARWQTSSVERHNPHLFLSLPCYWHGIRQSWHGNTWVFRDADLTASHLNSGALCRQSRQQHGWRLCECLLTLRQQQQQHYSATKQQQPQKWRLSFSIFPHRKLHGSPAIQSLWTQWEWCGKCNAPNSGKYDSLCAHFIGWCVVLDVIVFVNTCTSKRGTEQMLMHHTNADSPYHADAPYVTMHGPMHHTMHTTDTNEGYNRHQCTIQQHAFLQSLKWQFNRRRWIVATEPKRCCRIVCIIVSKVCR